MERVIVPNSVANRIITVGEPSRARKIAKYFDNTQPIIEVESKRGFLTLTGTYKNEKVSIIAIGMGLGVADMLVREVRAVTNGPLLIIRFGSCGGIGTAGDAGNLAIYLGMVSVCKEGAVLVTKNYDYWVQDYHYESEDEAEADSPLGKIFDTGYGVVTKAFHDTFRGIPYHISAVIPADLQLSTHLYYYLQEHVGVDNTCTGINATADSFYSSQGRTGDVFGDDNEKLISAIRKKLPFAETLEMESGMILHLAQCATFESKKNPNHPGPIRATACAMIFFNRNTTEAIDHDLIDELEKNAGRACLDAIVETAF
ncbi:hypothetical protein HK103_002657 [Boothiomyces macroporosus]|uniref:Nucleoside phosphorylase domain-containing protein n=1 Tax=Boothiomyces macroporosus TaxID=261099 RepID=A0AAD5Y708_9FUNG|nr:hypothetical protein HK103_002657 [Boothiomyces macroporosus]